jgi:hypothetical protein
MANYAIVDSNNIVVNVITWDGVSNWSPPVNTQLILITDITGSVSPKWTWNGTIFINLQPNQ